MKLCPICQRCYEDTDNVCSQDQTALVPSRPGPCMIAGKYRLDRLIGRGGMGTVYAGTHVDLDRPVAIKLLLSDFTADADALERFRREARAAARLNHQNVADTYDYGSLPEGGAYIVMELVDGKTLREYMNASGALPVNEAVMIARQVADGIEAAHTRGIVHRDLKPSNIILMQDHQNRLLAKVADFGVAKLKEHTTTSGSALTASGSLLGTPRYMSPEQCSGHATDARSDIYSLGVILYEMLTGRPPFDAPTATAIAIKHIQEEPPPLQKFRADVPAVLERLVLRALDKKPSARQQSATEFAHQLNEVAAGLPRPDAAAISEAPVNRPVRDPQTNRATLNQDTDPHQIQYLPETGRAGEPTVEDTLPPPAAQDDPSVQAYAFVPERVTETEPGVAAPQKPDQALLNETVEAKAVSQEPVAQARDGLKKKRKRRRTSLLLYAGLVAAIAAIAFSVGAMLFAIRRTSPPPTVAINGASTPDGSEANTSTRTPQTANAGNNPVSTANANIAVQTNSQPPGVDSGDARTELRSLLNEWIAATNAKDVDKQMAFYAPVLDTFYRRRNAPHSAVRAEKARLMSQLSALDVRVGEPETLISSDGRAATMRFRKRWEFKGTQPGSGEVVQELQWVKTDAGWKIKSERDVQVIR